MSNLSQVKNQNRWKPTVKLRLGQERLYQVVSETDKKQYSIQLPTGYGKSWCACIAYAVLRDKRTVNRMLIIVPTDQQRSQYIDGLREDLMALGISVSGIERCDNQATWVIKQSHKNESEVFVTTAASIAANVGYYTDLMSKGLWFVVADEFHHLANENIWGKAVKNLTYEAILGMSATPLRSDSRPTIFGNAAYDVEVSIREGYEEGAIKRIESRIGDYLISWSSMDSPDPQTCKMSELETEWGGDISDYELKKKVRYYDKYISEIFLQVLSLWSEYEAKWPGQNQILVFAMTCFHAELIAKIINQVAFPGFPAPFADWIGVGEGLNGNRSDKENSSILALFQENKLPCLVQVNKAGEGFNNKRCCIGLFLDMIGDTPMKRQHIGRFMRVNSKAPNQSSVIFVSEDSPAKALLENLEETFAKVDDAELKGKGEGAGNGRERLLTIPNICIIDTSLESERVVFPFGSPEVAMEKYIADSPKQVKDAYAMIPSETALEIFKASCEPWLKEQYRKQNPPLTSEQQRKQVADQVQRSVGILVAIVLRKRYGSTYPASVKNDLYRTINGRWKRMHSSHSEMTEADLKSKHKWLQSIAEEVNKGQIPTWLNL